MRNGVLAAVLLAVWAGAARAGEDEQPALAEAVLVTATRFERQLEETGATVSVITAGELADRQVIGAGRALETVPGARISLGGPPGSPSSLFLRGAASNQTLVLIDGIPLNDPTLGGQFNFFDLTVDGIERIEVLRGSASTLYGSEAIGGVVNLVTASGAGEPAGRATTEGGSYGFYRGLLGGSGSVDIVDLSASISKQRTLNDLRNNSYTNETYAGRVGVNLPAGLTAVVSGRYIDADVRDPWEFPFGLKIEEDGNIRRERNTTLGAVTLRQDLSDSLSWEVRGSLLHVNSLFTNGPDSGRGPDELRSRSLAKVREIGGTAGLTLPDLAGFADLSLLAGVDVRDEVSESRVRTSFGDGPPLDTTVRNRAIFLLAEVVALEEVTLSGGLRRERNTFFGWETTATASALFHPAAWETTFRANYGEGIRAPKPVEFNDPFVGNRGLTPETSRSFDAGISKQLFGGRASVDLTWFALRVNDLIAYDPETFRLENFRKTRTTGWELAGRATPVEGVRIRAWGTWQEPEDRSAGRRGNDQLPGRPRWFGGGEIALFGEGLSIGAEVLVSGDYPGTAHTTPGGDRRDRPGRKLVFALRGAVELAPGVSLRARIENLLDRRWYDDTTRPDGLGRGAYLGLDFTF